MLQSNENSLYVAFATSNEDQLDQHFGSCDQLMIYRLSLENKEHIRTVKLANIEGHNQQKIQQRLAVLSECFAVYCLACGNPVRQQLMARGTRVVIHPQIELIDNLLSQIQANWPGKIAQRQKRQLNKKQDENYFNELIESEWD